MKYFVKSRLILLIAITSAHYQSVSNNHLSKDDEKDCVHQQSATSANKMKKMWYFIEFVAQKFKKKISSAIRKSENNQHKSNNVFGMENDGNKCYMISVLQNLFSLPEFVKFFTDKGTEERPLLKSIKDLYSEICSGIGHPNNILIKLNERLKKNNIKNIPIKNGVNIDKSGKNIDKNDDYGFTMSNQHDANEFLTKLMEELISEDINSKKETESELTMMFYSEVKEIQSCNKCNFSIETTTKFFFLYESIQETNKDTNCYQCDKKGIINTKKEFLSVSKYLLICLIRYDCDQAGIISKIKNSYDIKKTSSIHEKYQAVGFIEHIGETTTSGHYIAHTIRNGQWYIFSDRTVSIRECPWEKNYGEERQNVYIIFYERKDDEKQNLK